MVTFPQGWAVLRFWYIAWGFNSQKHIRFEVEKNLVESGSSLGGDCLGIKKEEEKIVLMGAIGGSSVCRPSASKN
jgi:hypothetical protein